MFARYVAIGDSQTEGLNDSDGRGGFIGWADRLARHLATANPDVLYANLAVRGRVTRQIHEERLAPAIVLQPDLITVMAGQVGHDIPSE
jgi:lysophospholipase L1-like esterase